MTTSPASDASSPGVRVEEEYSFGTKDGQKTLAELFDGRSQLLVYNFSLGRPTRPGGVSLLDRRTLFSLVLDASRFTSERLVETLLAAGGVQAALVAT
jgi:hypothetical protein